MKYSVFTIIGHIFRTAKLRNVFFACLTIAIFLPAYSTYHVLPHFFDQLMLNTEDEARRTAAHIQTSVLGNSSPITKDFLSASKIAGIKEITEDFGIAKLKVFSNDGTIIYSTESHEIGEVNRHGYFWNKVAKGAIFSKIVEKNRKSAEGVLARMDVAEVYVPIMNGPDFMGALEIYYDITYEKMGLDEIMGHSARLMYSLSGLLFVFVVIMLCKASGSILKKDLADKKLHEAKRQLEQKVLDQTAEIRVTQKTAIEALATLAENYDPDTGSHLTRIQKYVGLILEQLEKTSPYADYIRQRDHYRSNIQLASILHDIGKVAIDRSILLKPGRLTSEEFDEVKTHTVVATKVLAKANSVFVDAFGKDSYLALARNIALHHHEKWDGSGYPEGLAGEDIPLSARVVALADVYDALRTKRPYKPARSHAFSVAEICRDKGRHFDPHVVDAFLAQADNFDAVANSYTQVDVSTPVGEQSAAPGPAATPAL